MPPEISKEAPTSLQKGTVVSIVLNNFLNDSRVLKENISLQNAGYDVKVIALHEEPLKEFAIISPVIFILLAII